MSDEESETIRSLLGKAEREGRLGDVVGAVRQFLSDRGQLGLWNESPRPPSAPVEAEGRFGMIGLSSAMKAVYERIEKILPSSFPVLVYGESGTGKELVARALHRYGPRKDQPFFSTNCAAIPETLLEAELFGHRKGAFTGAVSDRKGHFVAADRGMLFLDEIGDMSPAMQTKLLRVLEDGEVRPVGGTQSIRVDVRVIAASNKKLQDLVAQGAFRQDLFFRINVLSVELPPLRERKEDIPRLVQHLAAKISGEMGRPVQIEPEAVQLLQKHSWPGNVRELENEMRRAAALSGGKIAAGDLRSDLSFG